jgi:hypothetical protein
MITQLLKSSQGPTPEPNGDGQTRPSRLAWALLPVMLLLSGAVLLLFGVSWWTTILVIVFVACPAATAVAMRICFCKMPGLPEPGSGRPKTP